MKKNSETKPKTKPFDPKNYLFDPKVQPFDKTQDGRNRQGPYLQLPLIWFQFMKRDDAFLLAYLWNESNTYRKVDKLIGGFWFYCTTKSLKKNLKMNEHAQARSLKRLEICKYIRRKFGPPPEGYGKGRDVRWIGVRRGKVIKDAQLMECGVWKPPFDWLDEQAKSEANLTPSKYRKKPA